MCLKVCPFAFVIPLDFNRHIYFKLLGAAAVASIAIPRSAVGGAAAAMRPVPSTNSASSQVTG